MVNKYINYLKKSVIFLLVLLIIVSYSFGVTYSNFIFNSDSHRAVEMFTSKLDYEVKLNNTDSSIILLKPGNNLINVNIKSLNNVSSYYKLIYENNNVNVNYFEKNDNNIISPNESIKLNLVIFNKLDKDLSFNINVVGGYITNNYEDVNIPYGYKEITNNINIGDIITLNNKIFRILNINDDGSYELLSDIYDTKDLNGAYGYNHMVSLLNDFNEPENTIIFRSVNLSDISKYLVDNPIDYSSSSYYSDAYYPSIWEFEDSIINNNKNESSITNEEEVIVDDEIKHENSITVKETIINNLVFKNEKYKNIFLNSNYLLATRYSTSLDNNAQWGILSIKDENIELNKLFESNNTQYEINNNIRVFALISNKEDLFNKSL